jgi:hypothetical protein
MGSSNLVGPVLTTGPLADVIIEILQAAYPDLQLVDRGAYVRVMVPERCVLSIAAVKNIVGNEFTLPRDLEVILCAKQGNMRITEDAVIWEV